MFLITVFKKVSCTFKLVTTNCCGQLVACSIKQAIEKEEYVFGSPCAEIHTCVANKAVDREGYMLGLELNTSVEAFEIKDNKEVKFLPRFIGEKFPKLKVLLVKSCGLTVLRNHVFKDMDNLQRLSLYDNKITTIESNAFKDLINVDWLNLYKNKIESLDEKLFATMVNLQTIYLNTNKIKFLSPTTFKIPGGRLVLVELESNVCINGYYYRDNFGQLEANIRAKCAR